MAKFIVTLKQHTPLIHFQAAQDYATIRATELKPKLDKFLIEYAFKDFDLYKNYLIGEQKDSNSKIKALDYKVLIRLKINNEALIEPIKSLYFANMGDTNNFKKAVFNKGDIEIEFFSLHKEIINQIEKNIAKFFAITNFGTRQNKGFGSFYIKDDKKLIDNIKEIKDKFLIIRYDQNLDYNLMMEDISVIYALMKTGVNFPDHPKGEKGLNRSIRGKRASYHKSFLFQYMLNKDVGNEKRFIKENFFRKELRVSKDTQIKKYVRGLLGISDGIEFKDDRRGKINYDGGEIERFKSPITFKIVDNIIAIIPEKINKEMYDKEFILYDRFDRKSIKTPNEKEFELNNFLFSFADYFNSLKVENANNFLENKVRNAKKRQIEKVVK